MLEVTYGQQIKIMNHFRMNVPLISTLLYSSRHLLFDFETKFLHLHLHFENSERGYRQVVCLQANFTGICEY